MMNFAILLATTALVVTGVLSIPSPFPNFDMDSFSADNHYGAVGNPWDGDCHPGWYYGDSPELYPDIPCLKDNDDGSGFCERLSEHPDGLQCPDHDKDHHHHHHHHETDTTTTTTTTSSTSTSTSTSTTPTPTPTPPPGYYPTFTNITCATQAGDYQTFGLVDTEAQCLAMCDSVAGCNFVNVYYDVNGKGGSTQLTCSLFTLCHDQSTADNCGGQSQPSGLLDYITNSDGFCKNGVSVSDPL